MTQASSARSTQHLIDALATARESARLQAHLLSLEARDRWQELESRIDALQSRIEYEGERMSANAADRVRELTEAVKEFIREHTGHRGLEIPVGQLMQPARACRPTDTLNEPARLMWELDCGAVPVVDEAGHLVGILTDRDICMAAYTRGKPLAALSVESTMSRHVVAVSPRDTLESVAVLMRQNQVRRIPVVERGRLVGIVTLADLARYCDRAPEAKHQERDVLVHTLAAISQPEPAARSLAAE